MIYKIQMIYLCDFMNFSLIFPAYEFPVYSINLAFSPSICGLAFSVVGL